jgi:uncharacterized protein (TIGR03086 family)
VSVLRAHDGAMTDPAAVADHTTDRRQALFTAFGHAAAVVAEVRPDQLTGPTPCPDYDVAALVDHLVGAGWRAVELGRGATPSGEELPHVELPDAPLQLQEAGVAAAQAWSEDRLASSTTMPWGETYTGSTIVDMYLSELVAHTFDLALATGQALRCEEELAAAALAAAQSMLRPEYRDMLGPGSPFGAEQPAGEDATTLERFAAFMGRRLDWHP